MPSSAARPVSHRRAPFLEWARPYRRDDLRPDLLAGLTIGAMIVPQAMAYAALAGLPPQVGLYASTVPIALYALLGSSRVLAVGPVAVVSLLTASALSAHYAPGSGRYVAAAAWLALLCAGVHVLLSVGRVGFLTDFISHPVIVGFTAAAGLIIGASQLKSLLGISVPRTDDFFPTIAQAVRHLDETSWVTLAVGLACIALLLVFRQFLPRWPGALIVVALSIAAVRLFDLKTHGVAVVGTIPRGLPGFGIASLPAQDVARLIPSALVITLVGFVEAVAVAKFYAARTREDLSSNRELFALGIANVGAGLFGGYPVTGSLSRTAVMAESKARTPLAGLTSGAVVVLAIVVLTPLFSDVPSATLAAIVVVAVIRLVDVNEMRHIFRVKRSEGIGLVVGFVATLALGVELGIAVAVGTSIVVMFARLTAPHTTVLGRLDGATYRNIERFGDATEVPGIRIIRIDTPLSFANASAVRRRLVDEIDVAADRGDRVVVLDLSGVNDVDVTGTTVLRDVFTHLQDRDLEVRMAEVRGPVRDVLGRAGLWDGATDRASRDLHVVVEEAAHG
jgi:SulP family sulfate permease